MQLSIRISIAQFFLIRRQDSFPTTHSETSVRDVKTNIESIAIKNLQQILSERGYTAETLFTKFDLDGNGTLSRSEFESSLRSITGQIAPNAIVNAVFGALDADSSGSLELAELLSIVESGAIQNISEGDSITVSGHSNEIFNGVFNQNPGFINGKPWYSNPNGCILYFYGAESESPSWNLDDRTQDGSNDWYRGGWTRAPRDGSLPLGPRRWVGVGKISLTASSQNQSSKTEVAHSSGITENTGTPESSDKDDINAIMAEFDMALDYFEGQVSEGEISVDQALEMANAAFDRKSKAIPEFLRAPAKIAWDAKIGILESKLRENIPSPESIVAGAAVVGTAATIASKNAVNHTKDSSIHESPVQPRKQESSDTGPTKQEMLEVKATEQDMPEEGGGHIPTSGLELNEAISSFEQAKTLSERTSLKNSMSPFSDSISFRVNSIERTFGIGISDRFRGGSTLIAEVEGTGEVEIRLPNDSDNGHFKPGSESEIEVKIVDWNAVRRRLVLESQ